MGATIVIILCILVILYCTHDIMVSYVLSHQSSIHIMLPIWPKIYLVILYDYINSPDNEYIEFNVGIAKPE